MLVAFIFAIGAAFVLKFPLVSLIVFALGGLLGIAVGATTSYSDMTIWGVVSFSLAVLSFFGRRELRRRNLKLAKLVGTY